MSKDYIREILFLIKDEKSRLVIMMVLFIVLSMLDLAGIGLIGPYISLIANPDAFFNSGIYDNIERIGLGLEKANLVITSGLALITIFLIKAVSAIAINYLLLKFCHRQSVALRSSLMNAYQNLPYIEYVQRNSSDYIHNINLADRFANGTLLAFLRVVCDATVVIAIVLLLAITDFLALVSLASLLISVGVIYDLLFRSKVKSYGQLSNEASVLILKSVQEAILGLKELRILGKERYFYQAMTVAAKKYADVSVKSSLINLSPRFLLEVLMISFIVFLVSLAGLSNRPLVDLIPLLGMFGVASIKLAPAATSIISGISKMRFYRDAVSRVYKDVVDITRKPVAKNTSDGNKDADFQSIRLEAINFSYPTTTVSAIKNLSVRINKSEVVGFVGSSGSGKTTLIDILLGLLTPQSGELLYNGLPINESSLHSWKSNVAYLPQEVFLVDDTLRKNIALGNTDDEIDNNKIAETIKKARLGDFVKNLPQGQHTVIGERGVRLSGGQRQRIALARAFYHQREVLVMDESTSALDSNTEREIVDEIKHLKGHNTMIIVAHRLSTLEHCDAIYRLENGVMSEKLTYEQLSTTQ